MRAPFRRMAAEWDNRAKQNFLLKGVSAWRRGLTYQSCAVELRSALGARHCVSLCLSDSLPQTRQTTTCSGWAILLGVMAAPFRWVWNLSLLKLLVAILAVNSLHVAMQIGDIAKERQMRRRQSVPQVQSAVSSNSAAESH